jgi:hypothetical protein
VIQLLFCVFLLAPLIALPLFALSFSVAVGVAAAAVSCVLALPLVIAAYAHLDLLRMKSRFGLNDDEVLEFSHLVPRLAATGEFAALPGREMRRSTKQTAADIIHARRTPADDGSAARQGRDRARCVSKR